MLSPAEPQPDVDPIERETSARQVEVPSAVYGVDGSLEGASLSRVARRLRRQSRMYGPEAAKRYLARLAELDDADLDRTDFYDRAGAALGLEAGTARTLIERAGRP